jgi:hypothetical protein
VPAFRRRVRHEPVAGRAFPAGTPVRNTGNDGCSRRDGLSAELGAFDDKVRRWRVVIARTSSQCERPDWQVQTFGYGWVAEVLGGMPTFAGPAAGHRVRYPRVADPAFRHGTAPGTQGTMAVPDAPAFPRTEQKVWPCTAVRTRTFRRARGQRRSDDCRLSFTSATAGADSL